MPPTDPADLVDDLVGRCETLHEQGRPVVFDDVCVEHPELVPEVRRQFQALVDMNRLLTVASEDDASPAEAHVRYEIEGVHAKGGLGVIYRAREAELKRLVALKFIKQKHSFDPRSRSQFRFEAEVTGRLEHPGVVPVYALGADLQGQPCYAMRMIEGQDLEEAVNDYHSHKLARHDWERRETLRELLGRFVLVCKTIAYAHSRGVLHRDIKPRNIRLGKFGETLVMDWGLAKPFGMDLAEKGIPDAQLPESSQTGLSASEGLAGTPGYLSPEQARREPTTRATDVYGLGATLYHILTGVAPQQGTQEEILEVASRNGHGPARAVNPSVPPALAAIVAKAMATHPEHRYESALELAEDVRRWLDDEPLTIQRDRLHQRFLRWSRRNSALAASLVFLVLLASVAGVAASLVRAARAGEALRTREAEHEREVAFYNQVDAQIRNFEVVQAKGGNAASMATHNAVYRALVNVINHNDSSLEKVRIAANDGLRTLEENERRAVDDEAHTIRSGEDSLRRLIRMLESWSGPRPLRRVARRQLGRVYTALGLSLMTHHSSQVNLDEVSYWLERGHAYLSTLASEPTAEPDDRKELRSNVDVRLVHLLKSGRFSEALELAATDDFSRDEGSITPAIVPAGYRWTLIRMQAEVEQSALPWSRGARADHAKACRLAGFLASQPDVSDAAVYNVSCAFSLASADATAAPGVREKRASRAVEYLGRITASGYFRVPSKRAELESDADLNPLRGRSDFREVLRRAGTP